MSIVDSECLGHSKANTDEDEYTSTSEICWIPPYTVSNDEWPLIWPRGGLPFTERTKWKDPYKIPIIRMPLSKNLCLFTACLNLLGTEAERKAFCAGNLGNPSEAFEDMCSQINGNGYEGQHILRYLNLLKMEGIIKSFLWKTHKNFRWPNVVLTKPHPIDTCLVIVGTSTPKDLFLEIQAKLKAIEFKADPKGPDTQTVLTNTSGYKKNRKVVKGRRWAKDSKAYVTKAIVPSLKLANQDVYHTHEYTQHCHALGVRYVPWYGNHKPTMDSVKEGNGTPVIFDNRWETSRQATPDNLNEAVYNVAKMYEFKLCL